jgi:hypothetical protein
VFLRAFFREEMGREDVVRALASMLEAHTGELHREVEVRIGRIRDGRYTSGVDPANLELVVAKLASYDGWSARSEEFSRTVHFGDVALDVDTERARCKRRLRSATFAVDGTVFAVRLSLSTEAPVDAATLLRRRAQESAVRGRERHSFEYKGKLRFDCTRTVTATVHAMCTSVPQCVCELEVEATGDVSADSMMLKVEDMLRVCAEGAQFEYSAVASPG